MNALFVTHDVGNYGASRSLQLLIRNYHYANIDLIVDKPIRMKNDLPGIRKMFGGHVRRVLEFYLPFDDCYKGKPEGFLYSHAIRPLRTLLWKSNKGRIYAVISEGKYDFIYLNSLVLNPMIRAEYPFIIHIREIYDGSNENIIGNMKYVKGAIFIDNATREPLINIIGKDNIIMNNPIDMTTVDEYVDSSYRFKYGDLDRNTIFSLIGVITESKGTHFIINVFTKLKNDNARLLIVGKGDRKYIATCKKLAENDNRIIFWGEEPEIQKIYRLSDYIIRGEAYQCVGRTIYEGLYAGCQVIIPGTESRQDLIFEYERFKNKINFYTPRSIADLLKLLEILAGKKIHDRTYLANTEEYVRSFHEFVVRTLDRSG